MEVNLIDYTHNAVSKLIYTKNTRLTQGQDTRERIDQMSDDEREAELRYMAETIPSSWEFVTYTFEILGVSRAFTHQFVRTRTGSFAHQSMRVQDMRDFSFLIPDSIEKDKIAKAHYLDAIAKIKHVYGVLGERGIPLEDARGILPINTLSNIIAQFNLRTLSEMARSRTGKRVQGEYRNVLNSMFDCVKEVHPWAEFFLFPHLFDDCVWLSDLISAMSRDNVEKWSNYAKTAEKKIDRLKKGV